MSGAMEDCGMFAVDCVVVCCCCPCFLLQITVFLFIRLPHKLAVKSKRIVLRKLQKRSKKDDKTNETVLDAEKAKFGAPCCDFRPCDRSSSCLEAEKVLKELMKGEGNSWMEAEMVWEELIAREGLFWFGSFWGIAD
ncbi:unnamed protein product [Musa hybrid cultivar]